MSIETENGPAPPRPGGLLAGVSYELLGFELRGAERERVIDNFVTSFGATRHDAELLLTCFEQAITSDGWKVH